MSRARGPAEPEILVLPDPASCAAAAADRLERAIEIAVRDHGRADVATTGGSTPGAIYAALLAPPLRARVPWERLHVWFGDERFVPRADPNANVWLLDAAFFPGGRPAGPLPVANVHPFPVDATLAAGGHPAECARRYASELRTALRRDAAGRPVFDAILVGIGPDGHLLSVFPHGRAFDRVAWAVAVAAPTHIGPHLPRMTLNPAVLDATPALLAVAFGADEGARRRGGVRRHPRRSSAAGPARPAAGRDVDPRRGGGEPPPGDARGGRPLSLGRARPASPGSVRGSIRRDVARAPRWAPRKPEWHDGRHIRRPPRREPRPCPSPRPRPSRSPSPGPRWPPTPWTGAPTRPASRASSPPRRSSGLSTAPTAACCTAATASATSLPTGPTPPSRTCCGPATWDPKARLTAGRVPSAVMAALRALPRTAKPMDALRTAVSVWGATQTARLAADRGQARALTAFSPSALAAFVRLREGLEPIDPDPKLDLVAGFLYQLRACGPTGRPPAPSTPTSSSARSTASTPRRSRPGSSPRPAPTSPRRWPARSGR